MTDYMFGSARVRALESRLIGRERMEELFRAKSVDDIWKYLIEYGVTPLQNEESGKPLREETLLSILKESYDTVSDMLGDDKALQLWRYPYDCNNLKAAIKAFDRKIDARSMMFDFGTVDCEAVIDMVVNGNFEGLPPMMCEAAAEAISVYSKTRNPQQIDLILDRACYADMLFAAEESGSDFAVKLVKKKIDLTNFMICVRILRMNQGASGRAFLGEALIDGGTVSIQLLARWFDAGEETLWNRLYFSDYSAFAAAVASTDKSITAIERSADNAWMADIRSAKLIPYGSEVVIAYLLASEYAVRNLRILLAGKEAGLKNETIRERIRDSYV